MQVGIYRQNYVPQEKKPNWLQILILNKFKNIYAPNNQKSPTKLKVKKLQINKTKNQKLKINRRAFWTKTLTFPYRFS